MPSGKRWSWRVSSGVLALALAGCQYYYETPRPAQFTPAGVDMIPVDSIVKYWRGLDYDSVKPRVHDSLPHKTTYTTHPGYEWRQSIARWHGSQWGGCGGSACCAKQ